MKHPHAEKITQFARMVEAGHPIEQLVQRWRREREWESVVSPTWVTDAKYRVALAFVEGRPVFAGDVLYFKEAGVRATFNRRHDDGSIHGVCCDKYGAAGTNDPAHFLTWDAPLSWPLQCRCVAPSDMRPAPKFKVGDMVQTIDTRSIYFVDGVDQNIDGIWYSMTEYATRTKVQAHESHLTAPRPARSTQTVITNHEERIARLERLVHP